jgi:hypothetical protein
MSMHYLGIKDFGGIHGKIINMLMTWKGRNLTSGKVNYDQRLTKLWECFCYTKEHNEKSTP